MVWFILSRREVMHDGTIDVCCERNPVSQMMDAMGLKMEGRDLHHTTNHLSLLGARHYIRPNSMSTSDFGSLHLPYFIKHNEQNFALFSFLQSTFLMMMGSHKRSISSTSSSIETSYVSNHATQRRTPPQTLYSDLFQKRRLKLRQLLLHTYVQQCLEFKTLLVLLWLLISF